MKLDSSLENKPVILLSNNDGCSIARSNQAKALEKIFLPGYKYKKAGVMLMGITGNSTLQLNFRDKVDRDKHKRLMEVLDRTNEKYGRSTLKLATLGDGQQWKIKQERLSPCYTTRIHDFPRTI